VPPGQLDNYARDAHHRVRPNPRQECEAYETDATQYVSAGSD